MENNENTKPLLDMVTSSEGSHPIEVRVDYLNNKIYWETKPFNRDGKIIIKRLAEEDIIIEKAYQIVQSYEMKGTITEAPEKNDQT